MAKVNLDISDKLDITSRVGDTFELVLTLKDSGGTGFPLVTNDYEFIMQVRKPATPQASIPNQPAPNTRNLEEIVIGSTGQGTQGPVNFEFKNIDDVGNVTVFLGAAAMRTVPPGKYVYDFQYITGDTHKTLLRGRFTVNDDVSKVI